MLKLYGASGSGNCYKVKLLLEQLGRPYEWIEVDILKGETRSADFLRRNPNGRVPVVELEPEVHLAESNAILCYLGEGTRFLPEGRLERARVLQWLFFEQYSHEPYIATSRFIIRFLDSPRERREELKAKRVPGYAALNVMEEHLARHEYFVAERYTIADVALYAYTHVAHEGGFELTEYPAIRAWLGRVASQPAHVAMHA